VARTPARELATRESVDTLTSDDNFTFIGPAQATDQIE
jgi:hypothetical protein